MASLNVHGPQQSPTEWTRLDAFALGACKLVALIRDKLRMVALPQPEASEAIPPRKPRLPANHNIQRLRRTLPLLLLRLLPPAEKSSRITQLSMASTLYGTRALSAVRQARSFSSSAKCQAAEVKRLGVIGAGQMVYMPDYVLISAAITNYL